MASPPECLSEENAHFFIPFASTIVNPRLSALHDDNRCLVELPPACQHSLLVRQTEPVSENDTDGQQSAYKCPVIRYLPSSLDFDAHYPSVDAHSRPVEVEPTDFVVESSSILTGRNVLKVCLKSNEILTKVFTSSQEIDPVTLDNHSFGSAIVKISMTGLHRNAAHISILEMEFTPELSHDFWQLLSQVESIKISMQDPTNSKPQLVAIVNCVWFPTSRKLSIVVKDFLSHVKIFYWKSPCIDLCIELCDARVCHLTASDVPHPAFGIITPRPLIMAAVPDDNRILYNLPNVAHNSPEMHAALDDGTAPDFTVDTSEVACKDGNLRIRLNSAQLYSIIREGSVGKPYPETFKTTLPVDDCKFSVLLKVFPFRSRSKHISVWAEVTAPPRAREQVMLQVTTFDPRKEERFGRTVKCAEKLKHSDSGGHKKAEFTFDEVMLHMFAFYKIPDVELCISITAR